MTDLYPIEVEQSDGESYRLSRYRGSVLLIVNTASKCGFTPQYAGLEQLHKRFSERGLVVLGFPCNQFGKQEPGSNDDIQTFCLRNYGVSFPVHAKVDVNGSGAHPLFKELTDAQRGVLGTRAIKWNFTKFLVDRDGKVVSRHSPRTDPEDLVPEIERLLSASASTLQSQ